MKKRRNIQCMESMIFGKVRFGSFVAADACVPGPSASCCEGVGSFGTSSTHKRCAINTSHHDISTGTAKPAS